MSDAVEAAVIDRSRSGKPPKFTGEIEAQLVVLSCSDPQNVMTIGHG